MFRPGGKLKPGESEIDGLKRKLDNKLAPVDGLGEKPKWEVRDATEKCTKLYQDFRPLGDLVETKLRNAIGALHPPLILIIASILIWYLTLHGLKSARKSF